MPATGVTEHSIYYRLKRIDADGGIHYSRMVEAVLGAAPDGFAIAEVYPQPADGCLTVRFASSVSDATIRIVDVLGRNVAERRITTSTTVLLDVASLLPRYVLPARHARRCQRRAAHRRTVMKRNIPDNV